MAKTRQQKQESVAKLSEQLSKAKSVVFADYKGLTMKQLSDLRDKLRDVNAEFAITKNTLLERALATTDYQLPPQSEDILNGPTATLFAYDDEISPIKILVKTLKDIALGKVKSGFFGGAALDEGKILQLAALPTKLELRGQIVGVLATPLQGMVSVLQGNLRNLVYALEQIKEKQSAIA
ncbi:MAG: 50S ribosomal protein L10 [Candidatus Daviesbacteria bacterium]|nr:50S ribosomal protein L10 [Candidatus Daviesbacteria bacterium]